jgi:ArsR family transcriptional regulator, arsenate/arsenite/antimonite-responsive transcriptional repressor
MQAMLNIFKALSDEIRLRILKLLQNGELCVCDIVAALDMSQPKVSFHLSTLKDAGLIRDRKDGRWVHYSIDDSDLFRRFIILSAIERISAEDIKDDKERLVTFLANKCTAPVQTMSSGAPSKKRQCCNN